MAVLCPIKKGLKCAYRESGLLVSHGGRSANQDWSRSMVVQVSFSWFLPILVIKPPKGYGGLVACYTGHSILLISAMLMITVSAAGRGEEVGCVCV